MTILLKCANARDDDCSGHTTGSFVEEANMVLLQRDGIAVTLCCTCYVKLSDVPGEAEAVLEDSRPVLHPRMTTTEIVRRLVGG